MEQKTCCRCSAVKDIDQFHFRDKAKGLRRAHCNTCQRKAVRKHYEENHSYYISRNLAGTKRRRIEKGRKVWEYLKQHPCSCGESDPAALEFDHDNPSLKTANIGYMVQRDFSWQTIQEEIDKCTVRCANCHRKRTAKQFNWYKNYGVVV